MPNRVHSYKMTIQPVVCIGVYYIHYYFFNSWEMALGLFNSYIPGKVWRQLRRSLLCPLGVES